MISGCAGGLYLKLAGNLNVETINVVGQRPLAAPAGENILVLGSQTRDGQIGSHFGGGSKQGTDISDTAMLVHLSADRKHAVVTSIPRDLIVARPDCASRDNDHKTIPGSPADMFDLAMNLGGPSCAVATVEHMSGMRIDHFIRVDFNGFRGIVNAVGGVDVCVPAPGIHDWRSNLNLDPGHHTIRDQEALAFVRDRHGVGDGGDLGRIRMQQVFLASLAQKIESAGTLSNPMTLYKLADAATSSLTVDPGLGSIPKLVSLARQLRDLTTHNITFITAPNAATPNNQNRLMPAQPGFDNVFRAMAADQPINPADLKPRVVVPARPTPATRRRGVYQPIPGAEQVMVRVLNATHQAGTAARTARDLRRLGFHIAGLGQATPGSLSAITAGPGDQLLRSVVAGPVIDVPNPSNAHEVTLTVGMDFPGLHQPDPATSTASGAAAPDPAPDSTADAPDSAPAQIGTAAAAASSAPLHSDVARTADADICSGLPKPRTDAAVQDKRPDPKHPAAEPTAVAPATTSTTAPSQPPASPVVESTAGPVVVSEVGPPPSKP